jgi:hypothetical protein
MSREEFDTKLRARAAQRQPFLPLLTHGCIATVKGSTHNTYATDDALVSALIPGMTDPLSTIDGRRAVEVINECVVTFFGRHLKAGDVECGCNGRPTRSELQFRSFRSTD